MVKSNENFIADALRREIGAFVSVSHKLILNGLKYIYRTTDLLNFMGLSKKLLLKEIVFCWDQPLLGSAKYHTHTKVADSDT